MAAYPFLSSAQLAPCPPPFLFKLHNMLENDLDLGLIFNQKRLASPNLIVDLTSSKCFLKLFCFCIETLTSFAPSPTLQRFFLLLNVCQPFLGMFASPQLPCLPAEPVCGDQIGVRPAWCSHFAGTDPVGGTGNCTQIRKASFFS